MRSASANALQNAARFESAWHLPSTSAMSAGHLFPTFVARLSDVRRKGLLTGPHAKVPPRRERYRYMDDADYRAEFITTPYGRRRRKNSRRLKTAAVVSTLIVIGGILCLLL